MIALFTDFGPADPYVGQLHAVLAHAAPGIAVIDLFHSVPNYNIRAGAYLLPALVEEFPEGTVFVCVVDPGVGGARAGVMLRADGRWYVGPDNGLFHILARRARDVECRVLRWRSERLSASFHGRDLFAPCAARLAQGVTPDSAPATLSVPDGAPWPDELAEIIYIDHYGNGMTGLRAAGVRRERLLRVGGRELRYARVFAEVPVGEAFWYENAVGLVEIAVNQGDAAGALGLRPGAAVSVH
jgi:S-adenosylmethionine hydrolase